MKRRLFNAGALVSLCLFVLFTALWVRGLFYYDLIAFETWGEDGAFAEVCVHQINHGGGVLWMHRSYSACPRRTATASCMAG